MKTLRFLVIGRTREFLDAVILVLREIGFEEPTVTTDMEQGLDLVRTGRFNTVIVDGTADGFDCVSYLRSVMNTPGIDYLLPVLKDRDRDEVAGVVNPEVLSCISHPFNIDEFRTVASNLARVVQLKHDVLEKERRLKHLEVLNEIARKTLRYRDESALLWDLAELIRHKLDLYNVNIFLKDEGGDRIVLKAFAGGFGDDLTVGFSLRLGEGLSGWAAQHRESVISGDVRHDSRWMKGFSFEDKVESEIAVPIIFEDLLLGVLHVESMVPNAFNEEDRLALETVADQMSLTFRNLRLSRELIESKRLSDTINNSLPVSILVLDRSFVIEYANQTWYRMSEMSPEQVQGRPVTEIIPRDLMDQLDLENELKKVYEYGISISHSNIRHMSPHNPERMLNISISSVTSDQHPRIMILIQDVTEFTQKTYQLLLLREISLAMQGVLDRDRLLHLILTCVTAGFALGFSRAFLFLVDDERQALCGIMGVGPASYAEAWQIWDRLSRESSTFEDYLERFENSNLDRSSLQDIMETLVFDLRTTENVLTETIRSKNNIHVLNAWQDIRVDEQLQRLLASPEFVAVPLLFRNKAIGVLVADNAYSGRNIVLESIEVLVQLAGSAAIAIENAKVMRELEEKIAQLQITNETLKKTQDKLILSEKLAAIGEVSARLAHEIRNPLSTIGGFARSIPKRYEDRDRTIRNANIIVDEVKRLEHILTNVLDYSKPSVPRKEAIDVNELVRNTMAILESNITAGGVVTVLNFMEERLYADIDPMQIKQVLINIIQNALNAMLEGGALEISTRRDGDWVRIDIDDTGRGIPGNYLENIFEPFFTTRGDGTGLGLSISNMIIQNHNGKITIESSEGTGTTVTVLLPLTG